MRMRFLLGMTIPFLIIMFLLNTLHGLVLSDTGYRALSGLEQTHQSKVAQLNILSEKRQWMEERAALLQSENIDPDMIDERVRDVLGYAGPHDIVISRKDLRQMVAVVQARKRGETTMRNDHAAKIDYIASIINEESGTESSALLVSTSLQ